MLDSSFWCLKFGDILTICAIGSSPLVAVGLQKWFERIGSTQGQRLWIFKTLMTPRTAPIGSKPCSSSQHDCPRKVKRSKEG
jgi:hypothetical protein